MLIKKEIKSYFKIASSAAKHWWDKDPFMQSAVIAYYAILSISATADAVNTGRLKNRI